MNLHNTSMMNNFPYLYRGVVLDNKDPKNLGRCKVKVPSIHGSEVPPNCLPWARSITLTSVNTKRNFSIVPDIQDIVWVFFEGGDKDSPVYIGGTRGIDDIPVDLNKVIIYQEGEDIISYDRLNRTYILQIGDKSISVSPDAIKVKGNLIVEGTITATGDVVGNGISLSRHTHGGVESGGSSTSGPR